LWVEFADIEGRWRGNRKLINCISPPRRQRLKHFNLRAAHRKPFPGGGGRGRSLPCHEAFRMQAKEQESGLPLPFSLAKNPAQGAASHKPECSSICREYVCMYSWLCEITFQFWKEGRVPPSRICPCYRETIFPPAYRQFSLNFRQHFCLMCEIVFSVAAKDITSFGSEGAHQRPMVIE